ncbi:preprotein translocase subunit SecG [Pontibacter virosus]|uniref:Protein-export membrane protein SecG n=1 Tax=Pontibacter virosus TaxID=1765052 RepID=A0A2U1B198_9BACT|nr:preprotein translocase subunit SecG [Pontibacter virosus]PVY42456.1 preprotein translocase subunit SecG [Pontibacter virosus]
MYIALISIILFICVLLILVVLAQNPKGGGLSSQFGGGGASQLMGVKRTGDLLEKLTWGFAIALVVLTLGTHMMIDTSADTTIRSVNEERARQMGTPAVPALPGVESEEDMSIPDAGEIPTMVDTAQ